MTNLLRRFQEANTRRVIRRIKNAAAIVRKENIINYFDSDDQNTFDPNDKEAIAKKSLAQEKMEKDILDMAIKVINIRRGEIQVIKNLAWVIAALIGLLAVTG